MVILDRHGTRWNRFAPFEPGRSRKVGAARENLKL
jgi:hypothetical protein